MFECVLAQISSFLVANKHKQVCRATENINVLSEIRPGEMAVIIMCRTGGVQAKLRIMHVPGTQQ